MSLYYGAKMFPELNNPNILSYLERIKMLDLLLPFALEATQAMVDTEGKYDYGYYNYPGMKKYTPSYITELLLSVVGSMEDGESKDSLIVDEMLSEFALDDICDFTMNDYDNFDYISVMFGWMIYIKQLIIEDRYFPESDFKKNNVISDLIKGIAKKGGNHPIFQHRTGAFRH